MGTPHLLTRIIFVLALVMLQLAAPALAVPLYMPGVQPGQYARLGEVTAKWNPSIQGIPAPPPISDLLATNAIRTEVESVSGTSVTATQTWAFKNATGTRDVTLIGDVRTGNGNLTFWIIAGGLSAGDKVADTATAPTLNATMTKTYLGTPRLVNIYNVTFSISDLGFSATFKITLYWDQETGMLLELFFDEEFSGSFYSASGMAHAVVVETNLWSATPDFSIIADTSQLKIGQGSSGEFLIFPVSLNGFEGTASLTVTITPTGPVASLDTSTVYISSLASQTATVSVTVANTTPVGDYTVNVTATSGALHHTALVSVLVNPPSSGPDFTIEADPTFLDIRQGTFAHSRLILTGLDRFAGSIQLSAVMTIEYNGASASGLTATFTPLVVTLSAEEPVSMSTVAVSAASDTISTRYLLNVTASSSPTHHVVIVFDVVPASLPTYMPGVKPGDMARYDVQTFWNILEIPPPPFVTDYENVHYLNLTIDSVFGSTVEATQTFAFTNMSEFVSRDLAGDVESGTGTIFPWVIAAGLSPGQRLVNNSFGVHTINYTITGMYAGAARTANVWNFTFTLLGVSSQIVWYWDQQTGVLLEQYYDLKMGDVVQGLSDIQLFETNLWASVPPDFELSADPAHLTITQGSPETLAISLSSLHGFAGVVQLSAVSDPQGLAVSLPAQVTLVPEQPAAVTLTVYALTSPGAYTVTVTGTQAALSHRVTVDVTVVPRPDFTIAISPGTLSIQVGGSATSSITIAALYGFTGQVGMTVEAPSGMTVTLEPTTLDGSGTVNVNIQVASTVEPGTYTVRIAASQGPLEHEREMTVAVTAAVTAAPVQRSPPLLEQPLVLAGIAVAAVAGVGLAVFLARSRRKPLEEA